MQFHDEHVSAVCAKCGTARDVTVDDVLLGTQSPDGCCCDDPLLVCERSTDRHLMLPLHNDLDESPRRVCLLRVNPQDMFKWRGAENSFRDMVVDCRRHARMVPSSAQYELGTGTDTTVLWWAEYESESPLPECSVLAVHCASAPPYKISMTVQGSAHDSGQIETESIPVTAFERILHRFGEVR